MNSYKIAAIPGDFVGAVVMALPAGYHSGSYGESDGQTVRRQLERSSSG
jgi:hypothetical protein